MIFKEEYGDLFNVGHGYVFMHCISADFALGAGIAVEFDRRYNMRERLKEMRRNFIAESTDRYNRQTPIYAYPGEIVKIDNVINLITKTFCYEKPTLRDLRDSLETARDVIVDEKIKKIAIPKIGCGLDRLDWETVKEIIDDVFEDTDIEIKAVLFDDED